MEGRKEGRKEGGIDLPHAAWPRGYDVDSGTQHGVIWSTGPVLYSKYFIMHKACFKLRDTHAVIVALCIQACLPLPFVSSHWMAGFTFGTGRILALPFPAT